MTEVKRIADFEFNDHGVDSPDCFQGVGTTFTDWDFATYGIGCTKYEAIDDCIDMLAQAFSYEIDCAKLDAYANEWKANNVDQDLPEDCQGEDSEMYFHVSVRVKFEA